MGSGNRSIAAIVVPIALLLLVIWTGKNFYDTPEGMSIYPLEGEPQRMATRLFFEKMTAIAQLSIALLGGMWAFFTLSGTQIKINKIDTKVCFVSTNIAFAVSLLIYTYGYDFFMSRIFHHNTFDIDAPFVTFVRNYQQVFFLFGCISLVTTIVLGKPKAINSG